MNQGPAKRQRVSRRTQQSVLIGIFPLGPNPKMFEDMKGLDRFNQRKDYRLTPYSSINVERTQARGREQVETE